MTERLPPQERPTAAELAAQSRGGMWECPKCGCRDLRGESNSEVESTRNRSYGDIRRRRVCRHCGQHAIVTSEVPVPAGYVVQVVPKD